MSQSNTLVMRRSIILWVATAAVIAFNLFAASGHDGSLTYAALLLTGAMALFGIGFGLWAARILGRRPE